MSATKDRDAARQARMQRSKKRLTDRALGFLLIARDQLEAAHLLGLAEGPDPELWRTRNLLRRVLMRLSGDVDTSG